MLSCDQLAEEENEQRRRQEQMLLEKMEQEEQQEEDTKVRFRPEFYSSLLHSSVGLHRSASEGCCAAAPLLITDSVCSYLSVSIAQRETAAARADH